ncbi:DUF4174 domain-containing protein [Algoriphagus faecimaris]|nr:DUF4174 domain-containing protein [Algoriphagus faecimaris]
MLLLGFSWFILIFGNVQMERAKALKDFRWENRILIIKEASLEQVEDKELEDRKLLYFQFQGDSLNASNYEGEIDLESFEKMMEVRPSENWFLIGLDGGLKRSGKGSPELDQISKIIDAMPMRQSEIRRGKIDGFPKKK